MKSKDDVKQKGDKVISFNAGSGLTLIMRPLDIFPTKLLDGRECYEILFSNGFRIFVEGDRIYNLWEEGKLTEMEIFVEVKSTAVMSCYCKD